MDTHGGCRHKRLARQFLEMPQGYHLREQMLQIVPCESVQGMPVALSHVFSLLSNHRVGKGPSFSRTTPRQVSSGSRLKYVAHLKTEWRESGGFLVVSNDSKDGIKRLLIGSPGYSTTFSASSASSRAKTRSAIRDC
jgi:hypothetical protein